MFVITLTTVYKYFDREHVSFDKMHWHDEYIPHAMLECYVWSICEEVVASSRKVHTGQCVKIIHELNVLVCYKRAGQI